jgi:hypothetical protein
MGVEESGCQPSQEARVLLPGGSLTETAFLPR